MKWEVAVLEWLHNGGARLIREADVFTISISTNGTGHNWSMAVAILWWRGLISRETACAGVKDLGLL